MLSPISLLLCVGLALQAAQSSDVDPTQAAEADSDRTLDLSPTELPPMVVRAPRADRLATQPSTQVSVVSRDELLATGERSLPRMIGAATGVWIQETNLGGGSPFIRGLTGNQVLLVIDGVRVNDSTTRFGPNQNLNGIDPSIVERVEVIRGPASVIYGSDAIAGVVSVWTRTRLPSASEEEQGLKAEQRVELQSQTDGFRGQMNVSDATEDFGWFVSGSYQQFEDLRGGDGETQEFTGYQGGELFGSAFLDLGDSKSLRLSSRFHRDVDVPRTDRLVAGFGETEPRDSLFQFALQEYIRHQVTYSDQEPGWFADEHQTRLSFRRSRERRERRAFDDPPNELRTETDQVLTVGIGADWKKYLPGDQVLTWGFDADLDDIDSGRVDTDGVNPPDVRDGRFPADADYLRWGIFVQDELFTFDPVDVTLGMRYSRYDFDFDGEQNPTPGLPVSNGASGDFDEFTASLQVAGNVTDSLRLSGTLAEGFRAPNLADLSQVNTFGGGIEVGNPNLDPEESLYGEIAADYTADTWDAGVGFYHNSISDVVARQFDADLTTAFQAANPGETDSVFQLVNRDTVTVWGFEVRGRTQLGGGNSGYYAEGNLAFQRGRQYSDDPAANDQPFRRIPPTNGQVTVGWAPEERKGSSLERVRAWTRFADDQSRLSPGDISDPRIDPNGTPGWAIFGIGFDGRLGVWDGTWTFILDNLLDKNYRIHGSGFDAPGFSAILSLQWRF